ncbi:MAG: hypothetical protein K2I40_02145, partial [Bifidobacterium castoris]|nr:hypothetical protein [Bifidobacterium castoris]
MLPRSRAMARRAFFTPRGALPAEGVQLAQLLHPCDEHVEILDRDRVVRDAAHEQAVAERHEFLQRKKAGEHEPRAHDAHASYAGHRFDDPQRDVHMVESRAAQSGARVAARRENAQVVA